jgi:alkanesulfonate monooxygenase SsuD/methylene tetrahydromethanopterin reductase-like flavin-dependent oxidoreductase (luciferase family)
LAIFFSTRFGPEQVAVISAARTEAGRSMADFDVVANVPLVVGDDVDACAAPVRSFAALSIGGMGSREQNFYNALAARMGYPEEAADVQRRYLARDYDGAAAAVPAEFVDATALLGPPGRIADRMGEYAAAGVTTLSVTPAAGTLAERLRALDVVSRAAQSAGVAS